MQLDGLRVGHALPSGEITTFATENDESSVRRFVFSLSISSSHRLESGVSALRMVTVNFFSRRSVSSASALSLATKWIRRLSGAHCQEPTPVSCFVSWSALPELSAVAGIL